MDLSISGPHRVQLYREKIGLGSLRTMYNILLSLLEQNVSTNTVCAPLGQMPQLLKCSGVSSFITQMPGPTPAHHFFYAFSTQPGAWTR